MWQIRSASAFDVLQRIIAGSCEERKRFIERFRRHQIAAERLLTTIGMGPVGSSAGSAGGPRRGEALTSGVGSLLIPVEGGRRIGTRGA